MVTSLIFLSTSSIAEIHCEKKRRIRFVREGRKVIKKLDYCTGHKVYKVISSDCMKSDKCQAVSRYKYIKPQKIKIVIGSMLHHRCYQLKGNPILVEVLINKKWKETGLCQFSDNSFISIYNTLN